MMDTDLEYLDFELGTLEVRQTRACLGRFLPDFGRTATTRSDRGRLRKEVVINPGNAFNYPAWPRFARAQKDLARAIKESIDQARLSKKQLQDELDQGKRHFRALWDTITIRNLLVV